MFYLLFSLSGGNNSSVLFPIPLPRAGASLYPLLQLLPPSPLHPSDSDFDCFLFGYNPTDAPTLKTNAMRSEGSAEASVFVMVDEAVSVNTDDVELDEAAGELRDGYSKNE
jgi:hypothetical protein